MVDQEPKQAWRRVFFDGGPCRAGRLPPPDPQSDRIGGMNGDDLVRLAEQELAHHNDAR